MKKIILMAAITVFGTGTVATSANAFTSNLVQQGPQQGPQGTPEERAERQVKMMTEQLALTADQSTKVKALVLEQSKEMAAIREKNQGNREAMMEAMKPLREKYTAQFKAVLTAEQFTKYEASMARRGGQGSQGGQGRARSNGAGQGNN